MDADDIWAPEKLKKQLAMIKEKGTVICSTARELMKPDGTYERIFADGIDSQQVLLEEAKAAERDIPEQVEGFVRSLLTKFRDWR